MKEKKEQIFVVIVLALALRKKKYIGALAKLI